MSAKLYYGFIDNCQLDDKLSVDSKGLVTIMSRPFVAGTEREAVLKVIEEAAEVFAEWQETDRCNVCAECDMRDTCEGMYYLACAIADCIQACVNLASRYGIDLADAMERCEHRNRGFGYYEEVE